MIEVKNVVKKYGKVIALDNVNLKFEEGKIIGLLGINGVGKSTTLKAISGLIKLNKGEILIDGIKLNHKVYEHIALIADIETYYGYMTVEESFNFMDKFYENWNMDKAYKMLENFKIDKNKKIATLSKGNIAKVKLILGFAREPKYLLLDEPFSGIDMFTREVFINSIIENINENMTIIITTHEVNEIENIVEEVILLNEGKVIYQFDVEDVKEQEGLSIVEKMREVYKNEVSCK
ncbi:ABC transporter ATP-binding protein [Clostridium massiliamazoniense]|uniref:ABC transporter ATP-binding protein n=1 Tax=Clostridium massiliamazoniense TaxID=1347366 RepID=UPI0006D7766D|nr:ABC transporter ATP-binding protein [Clostridium massiliamazoniense]